MVLLTANRSVRERCRLQDDVHSVTVPEVNSMCKTGSPLLQVERVGTVLKLAYSGKYSSKITHDWPTKHSVTHSHMLRSWGNGTSKFHSVYVWVLRASKPNNSSPVWHTYTHKHTHTMLHIATAQTNLSLSLWVTWSPRPYTKWSSGSDVSNSRNWSAYSTGGRRFREECKTGIVNNRVFLSYKCTYISLLEVAVLKIDSSLLSRETSKENGSPGLE